MVLDYAPANNNNNSNISTSDDDQLLCTVYTALLTYVQHFNLLPAHHIITIPSPKRSPTKRILKRAKVLGKRRTCGGEEEWSTCDAVAGQPEYKRPHLMAGGALVYPPDAVYSKENDPYMDMVSLSGDEAERCLLSLASLCHLTSEHIGHADTINLILQAWARAKAVDYEQLVYLLESMIVLHIADRVDFSLLSQIILLFLNVELSQLKLVDKKSQKLALFLDLYRIFSRLNACRLKWTTRIQQLGCELILQCFESGASRPASWSCHFAVNFCSLLASCLFPQKSAYYQPLCDVCQSVVSM